MSKLENVLEPMEDLWFQLGQQLNVEVEDIQEKKLDTKEQMRSLLQRCSDKGVTMMQLEEALVALDQKNLIPGMCDSINLLCRVCFEVLQELSKVLEPDHKEKQRE